MTCEWFALCEDESVATVEHPTLGDVEICAKHSEWLQTDWSPTKMIPPIAARSLKPLHETIEQAAFDRRVGFNMSLREVKQ